jgi:hypothetical protein
MKRLVRLLIAPTLALITSLSPLTGHSATSLDDLQPCPNALATDGQAEPQQKWELTLSPYTYHWRYNPDHRPVFLGALDRELKGGGFCGLALFRNSFGQPSAYAYVGHRWDNLFGNPRLFSKVSAGFIYGYKGEYKDKIPFNQYGLAPAIIPSVGYKFTPTDSAQIMVLGTAGVLFAYGHAF